MQTVLEIKSSLEEIKADIENLSRSVDGMKAKVDDLGQSPAKAVENMRLEAARNLMEDSIHSIEAIAQQTGFGDADRMRRTFVRTFGQSPQVIRRATGRNGEIGAGM